MKRNKIIILIGTLAAIAVLNSCSDKSEKTRNKTQDTVKKVPVKVVRVEEKMISVPLNSIGKVHSQKESSLSFKTGGIIEKILVNNGQKVRKNDLLAKLDLSEVASAVKKAKVAFDKTQRDLIRAENLYKENVVTLEAYENAKTAFDIASSDLTIAEFNLTHSVIKAPSNGLIIEKMSEEGELTQAGVPVFEFAGTNQNWVVKTGLVDKEVVKIAIGDSADISFDAYPNDIFNGIVSKISNAPNPINGTYEVEISLRDIPSTIKKGFIAKVELIPSKKQNYKLIPIESLAEADNNDGIIYTVEADKPKKVNVKIETIINDKVLVYGDLKANDLIISEGLANVTENSELVIL